MRILFLVRRPSGPLHEWAKRLARCTSEDVAIEITQGWMPEDSSRSVLCQMENLVPGFDAVFAFGERVILAMGELPQPPDWFGLLLGPAVTPRFKLISGQPTAFLAPSATLVTILQKHASCPVELLPPPSFEFQPEEPMESSILGFRGMDEEANASAVAAISQLQRTQPELSFNWVDRPVPATLALFPSCARSFDLRALQCLEAGVPIVVREDTPTSDLVIHGKNGLLFKEDSLLASVLQSAIQSTVLLETMQNGARVVLEEELSPDTSAGILKGLLAQ